MTTKIKKWGNSLGIRIPQRVAHELGVVDGSEVNLIVKDQEVIIKRADKKPSLDELLSGITAENRHEEIDFGAMGSELI